MLTIGYSGIINAICSAKPMLIESAPIHTITNILRIGQKINTRLMNTPKGRAVCPDPLPRLIIMMPTTAPTRAEIKNIAMAATGPNQAPTAAISQ